MSRLIKGIESVSWSLDRRTLLAGLGATLATCLLPRNAHAAVPALVASRAAPAGAPKFSGDWPGPILRAKQGAPFEIEIDNRFDRPFSVHWQGVRLDNASDGAAGLCDTPIPPGARRTIRFVPPDAGTYIYRADTELLTDLPGLASLSGVLVVDEDAPRSIRQEVLAVSADPWRLASPETGDAQAPRARTTVNGAAETEIALAAGERVLLRIGNIGVHSPQLLRFSGVMPSVVAIDGQPCPAFPPLRGRIVLPPGGRVDLEIVLAEGEGPFGIFDDFDRGRLLARIVKAESATAVPEGGEAIAENPRLPREIPLENAARASLALGSPGGGRTGPALLTVERGRTVVLAFQNNTGAVFAVHWHGHAARLLDAMDDGWKPWWHDSLIVPPNMTMRIALVADNPGRWAIDAMPLAGSQGAEPTASWFEVT